MKMTPFPYTYFHRVTSGWAAETMQELLVFLIVGVGRLREDQLIYVETRENVFFYDMGPLNVDS